MVAEKLSYDDYINILKSELIPAMGCTEPISVALAGAYARKVLDEDVTCVEIAVSNNILKNVKSVVVPNTGGKKGVKSAVAVGIVAGVSEKMLEVISEVTPQQERETVAFIQNVPIKLLPAENSNVFDIVVRVFGKTNSAYVRIADYHTNIVEVRKNNEVIFKKDSFAADEPISVSELLKVKGILEFVETVKIQDVQDIIQRQIEYNSAIGEEGMCNHYGAKVGQTLVASYGNDIKIRARAKAAAGSDARMSGCEMPVIVVSGSGNQGITASVPVVEYAKEMGVGRDKMIRAVTLSNLLTIHLKTGIGRLSAYCGAVSAGCAAGAAISYLHDGGFEGVAHTLVNALAIVSGIVCDGAKPSCAGKISSAIEAGILGWQMYENGQQFYGGDGIVLKGVENTIKNIARLGRVGMKSTDEEIVRMMIESANSNEKVPNMGC